MKNNKSFIVLPRWQLIFHWIAAGIGLISVSIYWLSDTVFEANAFLIATAVIISLVIFISFTMLYMAAFKIIGRSLFWLVLLAIYPPAFAGVVGFIPIVTLAYLTWGKNKRQNTSSAY